MAELPDINEQIGKDQIANETDNRQRLQKSLRAGLLNVVKSVDGMHNTLRDLYEMQKAGWDAQAMQAGLDLEAAREASRGGGLGGGGDGDTTINGDVNLDAGKSNSFLGKIGKGITGAIGGLFSGLGVGGGALLAGAGILAGGAGYLLTALSDFDADKVKQSVMTLLSIKDEFGSAGEFFKESGTFFLAMAGIGLGLAAFALGQGLSGLAGGMTETLDYFTGGNWAESIKQNVLTLLSIGDAAGGNLSFLTDAAFFAAAMAGLGLGLFFFAIGEGASAVGGGMSETLDYFTGGNWAESIKQNVLTLLSIGDAAGGNLSFLTDAAFFAAAMAGLGLGLFFFAIGEGASAVGGGMSEALDYFSGGNWAEDIKQNVLTLLSIGDAAGGNLSFLTDAAFFAAAMAGLGLGLFFFAIGEASSAVGGGMGEALDTFTGGNWAETIKQNVLTLLSIKDEAGGNLSMFIDSAVFAAAMAGIGLGLVAFAVGGVAGAAAAGAGEAVDKFTGGNWAEQIKQNVITLLSIKDSLGGNWEMLKSGGAFFLTMSGIGAGLAAFAFGSGAAGVAEAVNKFASEEDMADRIVRQVKTLLTLTEEGAVAEEKANIFSRVMGTISSGLMKFAGGKFVAGLADAGTAFLNFLSGGESPIQEMLNIADRAADIFAGANAIDKVGDALNKISGLKFDGSNINMTDFANDLMRAIPAIETAIMGGVVGEGFFSSGTTIKGLASPDIKFEQATKRIKELQMAINPNAMTATTGAEIDVRSSEVATAAAAPSVTDNTTTTAITNNTQNSVQSTTVASMSPYQRKVARIDRKRARLAKLQYG